MKKLVVLVVLLAMLAIIFSGCGRSAVAETTSRPNGSAVVTTSDQMVSETISATTSAPVATTTEAPQEEVDPIAIYQVSTRQGIFFLKRSNRFYALYREIKMQPGVDYYAGRILGNMIRFIEYTRKSSQMDDGRWIEDRFIYGGLPIMEIQEGDRFVGFSNSGDVPSLWYSPVLSIRYTVDSEVDDSVYKKNLFTMVDLNGNTITPDRYGDLEYGETYTLSWYDGTVYHEERRIADAIYITVYCYSDESLIQGRLTKEGYAVYDVDLEPGLYLLGDRLVRIS
jgi:hypothetical protein